MSRHLLQAPPREELLTRIQDGYKSACDYYGVCRHTLRLWCREYGVKKQLKKPPKSTKPKPEPKVQPEESVMMDCHAKPLVNIFTRCPKCQSAVTTDPSWLHGRPLDTWRCTMCGLTGDSDRYYDALHRRNVEIVSMRAENG